MKIGISKISKRALVALACIFVFIVVLMGVVVGAFFALKTSGRISLEKRRENEITVCETEVDAEIDSGFDFDPGVIIFEGKKYRYNEALTNFLFMGVDSGSKKESDTLDEKETLATAGSGQADVLLVVVLDEKAKKASIISVDRNSMAYFEGFDGSGNSLGVHESQLALAYAFGDGAHTSCKMTVSAVSDFLYEVPIHAYYSMKRGAIGELNDAVGGVKVTVPIDMTSVDKSFVKGEEVLLLGKTAEKFIVARQSVGDGSNAGRIERQKIYLSSFIKTAVSAVKKDWSLPRTLYEKIAENSCTDITVDEVVYLADLATKIDVSFYSIPGYTDTSGVFAEFRPDSDAFWRLILDIFYICEE